MLQEDASLAPMTVMSALLTIFAMFVVRPWTIVFLNQQREDVCLWLGFMILWFQWRMSVR